jgi:hypothetical protein
MHQANHAPNRIDEKNGAAIGYVNAEANAALICDKSITVLKTFGAADGRIDDSDFFSVDLLRGNERHLNETMCGADFPMDAVKPRERFRLVVRHLEAGHA